jgi:uncharacterized delta-60 repeat protein
VAAPEIEFPPKDREVVVGSAASFGVIPRDFDACFQWYKDGVILPSGTNDQIVLERTQLTDAATYSVVVSNGKGVVTNSARLSVRAPRPGDVDFSFQPALSVETEDFQIALRQPDGKFVLVGAFDQVNGDLRGRIARVNPDGSTDRTFTESSVGGGLDWASAASLQNDGKLLVGGSFHSVNGESWLGIPRLNRNGSLDRSFRTAPAFPNNAWSFMPLSDGRIMIFGEGIYRLNPNGSIDPTFSFSWPPETQSSVSRGIRLPAGRKDHAWIFRRTKDERRSPEAEW